ncbi:MAG: hypothetical protein LBT05_10415 [Planctomycetaceae bacterium]|jgi:hypothetical protein|nr:hypothetical protein [Planctomycetaceae bacterium]
MKKRKFLLTGLTVVLYSSFFVGCEEPKPEGMPKLHPVTLTFQQEGKPLAEASIRLLPQFPCTWFSGGSTDANGHAKLVTHGKYNGIPAGKYKICVDKFYSEGDLPSMDPNKPTKPMIHYNLVETKYTLPDKTPLEIEVKEGKNSFEPFDLGKVTKEQLKAPGT